MDKFLSIFGKSRSRSKYPKSVEQDEEKACQCRYLGYSLIPNPGIEGMCQVIYNLFLANRKNLKGLPNFDMLVNSEGVTLKRQDTHSEMDKIFQIRKIAISGVASVNPKLFGFYFKGKNESGLECHVILCKKKSDARNAATRMSEYFRTFHCRTDVPHYDYNNFGNVRSSGSAFSVDDDSQPNRSEISPLLGNRKERESWKGVPENPIRFPVESTKIPTCIEDCSPQREDEKRNAEKTIVQENGASEFYMKLDTCIGISQNTPTLTTGHADTTMNSVAAPCQQTKKMSSTQAEHDRFFFRSLNVQQRTSKHRRAITIDSVETSDLGLSRNPKKRRHARVSSETREYTSMVTLDDSFSGISSSLGTFENYPRHNRANRSMVTLDDSIGGISSSLDAPRRNRANMIDSVKETALRLQRKAKVLDPTSLIADENEGKQYTQKEQNDTDLESNRIVSQTCLHRSDSRATFAESLQLSALPFCKRDYKLCPTRELTNENESKEFLAMRLSNSCGTISSSLEEPQKHPEHKRAKTVDSVTKTASGLQKNVLCHNQIQVDDNEIGVYTPMAINDSFLEHGGNSFSPGNDQKHPENSRASTIDGVNLSALKLNRKAKLDFELLISDEEKRQYGLMSFTDSCLKKSSTPSASLDTPQRHLHHNRANNTNGFKQHALKLYQEPSYAQLLADEDVTGEYTPMEFSDSCLESGGTSSSSGTHQKKDPGHSRANTIGSVDLSALRLNRKANELNASRVLINETENRDFSDPLDTMALSENSSDRRTSFMNSVKLSLARRVFRKTKKEPATSKEMMNTDENKVVRLSTLQLYRKANEPNPIRVPSCENCQEKSSTPSASLDTPQRHLRHDRANTTDGFKQHALKLHQEPSYAQLLADEDVTGEYTPMEFSLESGGTSSSSGTHQKKDPGHSRASTIDGVNLSALRLNRKAKELDFELLISDREKRQYGLMSFTDSCLKNSSTSSSLDTPQRHLHHNRAKTTDGFKQHALKLYQEPSYAQLQADEDVTGEYTPMEFSDSCLESGGTSSSSGTHQKKDPGHSRANTIGSVDLSALRLNRKANELNASRVLINETENRDFSDPLDTMALSENSSDRRTSFMNSVKLSLARRVFRKTKKEPATSKEMMNTDENKVVRLSTLQLYRKANEPNPIRVPSCENCQEKSSTPSASLDTPQRHLRHDRANTTDGFKPQDLKHHQSDVTGDYAPMNSSDLCLENSDSPQCSLGAPEKHLRRNRVNTLDSFELSALQFYKQEYRLYNNRVHANRNESRDYNLLTLSNSHGICTSTDHSATPSASQLNEKPNEPNPARVSAHENESGDYTTMTFSESQLENGGTPESCLGATQRHLRRSRANTLDSFELSALRFYKREYQLVLSPSQVSEYEKSVGSTAMTFRDSYSSYNSRRTRANTIDSVSLATLRSKNAASEHHIPRILINDKENRYRKVGKFSLERQDATMKGEGTNPSH